MKHCSTPSSFTPERKRNHQPWLNIIMSPPKPSCGRTLTPRLNICMCNKPAFNSSVAFDLKAPWEATTKLKSIQTVAGFPYQKAYHKHTFHHHFSESGSCCIFIFTHHVSPFSHWNLCSFCGLIPLHYVVLRFSQPTFSGSSSTTGYCLASRSLVLHIIGIFHWEILVQFLEAGWRPTQAASSNCWWSPQPMWSLDTRRICCTYIDAYDICAIQIPPSRLIKHHTSS